VAIAFVLDHGIQEFPEPIHPVAAYGSLLAWLDRSWARPRLVAVVAALGFPIAAAAGIAALSVVAVELHRVAMVLFTAGVLFATTSRQLLVEIGHEVVELSAMDPAAARDRLPALVGRDPAALSEPEIRSAAVESAAENLADGLVAPLLAFVVFAWSLPLAVGAATYVKAVNTGDSMFGYRSHPLGRPFARLDDMVMWIPARLSALLVVVAALSPRAIHQAARWSRRTASPNAGWPMAAVAGTLGITLEKPGSYVINPKASLPTATQAEQGIRIVNRAGLLAFAGAAVIAWY